MINLYYFSGGGVDTAAAIGGNPVGNISPVGNQAAAQPIAQRTATPIQATPSAINTSGGGKGAAYVPSFQLAGAQVAPANTQATLQAAQQPAQQSAQQNPAVITSAGASPTGSGSYYSQNPVVTPPTQQAQQTQQPAQQPTQPVQQPTVVTPTAAPTQRQQQTQQSNLKTTVRAPVQQ
jgi:hypothetical protein